MTSLVERVKVANARGAVEESVGLRVAVATAAVVAAHAVGQQDVGSPLQQALVLVGLPAAHAFSYRTRRWGGLWLKLLIAVGLLGGLAQFVGALTQLHGNAAAVQVPLAHMFLWTMFLHAWDLPARRDLGFALVASLVLIGTAGTLAVSSLFAVDLVVWCVASGTALVLLHARELDALPAPTPVGQTPTDGRAPTNSDAPSTPSSLDRRGWREAAVVVAVLALVAALGAGAFAVIPAAGSARAFTFPISLPDLQRASGPPGGLVNPSLGSDDPARVDAGQVSGGGSGATAGGTSTRASYGYFGFANRMDTGVRGRPDDTLVMRVRASAPAFWRGQSFDKWDGRAWTSTLGAPKQLEASMPLSVGSNAPTFGTDPERFVQTYYVERPGPNMIFAATVASQLYFADPDVYRLADGSLRAGVLLDKGAVYTVVSNLPSLPEEELRALDIGASSAGLAPVEARRYLDLPASTTQRVRDLAAQVTASSPSTIEKVRALEGWLGSNTQYSLDIPPLPKDVDAVDHFLFDERIGFCEQIGSSLVVLLRSLGIPARLVVGYVPGERNPFTGLFEVRASDAHAWAEVWFPHAGWLQFDPTASVPFAPGAERASSAAGNGSLAFLAKRLPSLPGWAPQALAAASAVMLVTAAVVAAGRDRARRRRLAARPWAQRWLDDLDRLGDARKRPRAPGETTRDYVAALGFGDDHEWAAATRTVEADLFAGRHTAADAPERARADALVSAARSERRSG